MERQRWSNLKPVYSSHNSFFKLQMCITYDMCNWDIVMVQTPTRLSQEGNLECL